MTLRHIIHGLGVHSKTTYENILKSVETNGVKEVIFEESSCPIPEYVSNGGEAELTSYIMKMYSVDISNPNWFSGLRDPNLADVVYFSTLIQNLKGKNVSVKFSDPFYSKSTIGPKGWETYKKRASLDLNVTALHKLIIFPQQFQDFGNYVDSVKRYVRAIATRDKLADIMRATDLGNIIKESKYDVIFVESGNFHTFLFPLLKKVVERETKFRREHLNRDEVGVIFGKCVNDIYRPDEELERLFIWKGIEAVGNEQANLLAARTYFYYSLVQTDKIQSSSLEGTIEGQLKVTKLVNNLPSYDICESFFKTFRELTPDEDRFLFLALLMKNKGIIGKNEYEEYEKFLM